MNSEIYEKIQEIKDSSTDLLLLFSKSEDYYANRIHSKNELLVRIEKFISGLPHNLVDEELLEAILQSVYS